MQHGTEPADAGAFAREQQVATQASDAWQLKLVMLLQRNVSRFETTTKISNDSAKSFARAISQCLGLMELVISGNDPGFLKGFAEGLGTCPTLEHLDLSSNNIQDTEIDSLLQVIQQCPKLVRLTLLDNAVGSEGQEKLREYLNHGDRGQQLQLVLHRS